MGSKAATEICTSMIGLAARPGTAVEPMWSIRSATVPSASRNVRPSSPNSAGQAGLYSTISILWREVAGTFIASRIPLGSGGRRVAVGPFDEVAVLAKGAAAGERGQVGRVYGAPAGPRPLAELEGHRHDRNPQSGARR